MYLWYDPNWLLSSIFDHKSRSPDRYRHVIYVLLAPVLAYLLIHHANRLTGARAAPRAPLTWWRYPAFCGTDADRTSRKRMRVGEWSRCTNTYRSQITFYIYIHACLSCSARLSRSVWMLAMNLKQCRRVSAFLNGAKTESNRALGR